MASDPKQDSTQDRILDAAEELFAEKGYDGTSLRRVTTAAQVNLAAVHYHFGNKLGLFQAIFERRAGPLNRERLAAMDRAEAGLGVGEALPLESILRAFFEPPVRMANQGESGFGRFLRIVGRLNSASGEHVEALRAVFAEVQERFRPALARALPHLGTRDLTWRFHLLIGAMCTVFADPRRIAILSEGRCDPGDAEELLAELVAFGAGALRAPATVLESGRLSRGGGA